MSVAARAGLLLLAAVLGAAAPLHAQSPPAEDRPTPFVPLRPLTRQDLDRREALKLYALGLLCEREDRLLEALRSFEKAAQLSPQAAPVFKALVPLYLALDRGTDALD